MDIIMKKSNSLAKICLQLLTITLLISISSLKAAPISIDGNLSDWSQSDRIDTTLVAGYELYGRHDANSYKLAIHQTNGSIGANTTIWLDTDQNSSSGYLIWGFAAGAEYNINIATDGKPYLYTGSSGQTLVSGPLTHSIISDGSSGTNMEISIPDVLLATPEEIHIFIDINDSFFLPQSYYPASNSYTISSVEQGIILNGDLSDWKAEDRIEAASTSVSGYELYGRYENGQYKLAINNLVGSISTGTTVWLDTDQNKSTGYKIWGSIGGHEFNVNISTDGKPYLYTGADGQTLISPLDYYIGNNASSGQILELAIPETQLNTPTANGIDILADINNSIFLPSDYNNRYTLNKIPLSAIGKIKIDGNKSDWQTDDRLDLGANNVSNAELYGRYEDGKYKLLLQSFSQPISTNTTIWLNTDQNASTAYQIWGFAGGAEYNINIDANGKPSLYRNGAGETFVSGSIAFANVADGTGGSILELEIPESLINTPAGEGINLLIDVNDSIFMPSSYSPASNQYVLAKQPASAPIAIIYSKTTEAHFFNKKAYAQLFMSVQSQAMMAGFPFDLLTETDLLDINKIKKYKTLVFPSFSNVKVVDLATIERNLKIAVEQFGIGIITAGNFLTNDETGTSLPGDAYSRMKLLMGVARTSGAGPVNVKYIVTNKDHPITNNEYDLNETIYEYTGIYTDYFITTGEYPSDIIATQLINNTTSKNALIAVNHVGRHAVFATVSHMVDVNLLWATMQWSVYGNKAPVSLQMSRENAIFVSRNDMDQSMFSDEVASVDGQLLSVLQAWKDDYNFVGSYYINIGDNPANQEETNWSYSAPLYQSYMELGNEIGTHSYTHPHDTNILTDAQIQFEFEDSRNIIEQNLGLSNIGGAVPGAPESLATSLNIIQYVDYLSGGYSSVGAGYKNAFGFLTPSTTKVYLSPNMSFDFTLIGFQGRTAEEAKQIWFDEFDSLISHNNQAIIHWPWHDYGPNDSENAGYSMDMFTDLIGRAYNYGAEFITGKDLTNRIKAMEKAKISVMQNGNTIIANVKASNAGQFSLKVPNDTVIASVENWYAYSDKQVFIDNDAGNYTIHVNNSNASPVTHITRLPSRSQLLNLSGDGTNLQFKLKGEGKVRVKLKCATTNINVSGAINAYEVISATEISLDFPSIIEHPMTNLTIDCSNTPPPTLTVNKDEVSAVSGTATTIEVLANDTGTALTLGWFDEPLNGTMIISNNKFTFTADPNFTGTEDLWYEVRDSSGQTDWGNLIITVTSSGNVTVTANDDTATVKLGNTVSVNVLANDTGSNLTLYAVDDVWTGLISIVNGKVEYVASGNYTGNINVWYGVTDSNGNEDWAMIALSITP